MWKDIYFILHKSKASGGLPVTVTREGSFRPIDDRRHATASYSVGTWLLRRMRWVWPVWMYIYQIERLENHITTSDYGSGVCQVLLTLFSINK